MLAISHYADDAWGVEPARLAQQAHRLWIELNTLVGWRIDMEKSPPPADPFKLLGGLRYLGAGEPHNCLHPAKLQAILARIHGHLD
eukprot:489878-Pyramimonas_sp.AAC.1